VRPRKPPPGATPEQLAAVEELRRTGYDVEWLEDGKAHAGMAWVFDRYVTDRALYAVQDEARTAQRGLWAERDPVAPWEWRRGGNLPKSHCLGGFSTC
jgi:hypothetical protein